MLFGLSVAILTHDTVPTLLKALFGIFLLAPTAALWAGLALTSWILGQIKNIAALAITLVVTPMLLGMSLHSAYLRNNRDKAEVFIGEAGEGSDPLLDVVPLRPEGCPVQ